MQQQPITTTPTKWHAKFSQSDIFKCIRDISQAENAKNVELKIRSQILSDTQATTGHYAIQMLHKILATQYI